MQRVYYRDDDGDIVEITDRFDLDDGFTVQTYAEEQSVSTSNVTADDPLGDFAISGHRLFFIHEDLATYFPRTWVGYTAERTYSRGETYRTGASRIVKIGLSDFNTLLARKVLVGSDCNRPDETDVARLQWLLGTTEMSFVGDATTYVDTSGPVAMDANDYRGQMTSDVIRDVMESSGKNAFLFEVFDDPDYLHAFVYMFGSSSALSSELRISNDLADIDADPGFGDPGAGQAWTWAASVDAELVRDPSRVFSGEYANFDGGAVYRSLAATIEAFADRDTITQWPNVKTPAAARARTDRHLATIDTEEDTITVSIEVSPEHLNDARAGERIRCRFTHLPGYEVFSWMRIMQATATFVTPERYRIDYTLSAQVPGASCAVQVAGIGSVFWAEGEHHQVNDTPPVVFTPGLSVAGPYVCIYLWAGVCNTEPMADPVGSRSLGGGYTKIGDNRDDYAFGYPTLMVNAYKAGLSGAAPEASISFTNNTGSGARSWNAIAIGLRTAATAPVQTAYQSGSGGVATWASPPTPGNVIVGAKFAETSGFAPPDPPTGFTRAGSVASMTDGIGHQDIEIVVRCVQAGDDTSESIGDANQSHWAWLSEWEIT